MIMKNLLHNISILTMIIFMMVGIQSCTNEREEVENVEVRFTAMFPNDGNSRTYGIGIHVNTLVCGIFDEYYNELERKFFKVESERVDIELTLAQRQVYHLVFWAYNNTLDLYDQTDLTAVKMKKLESPVSYEVMEASDAFFGVIENYKVTNGEYCPVDLIRPLAQINVGTVGETKQATFIVDNVPDTFYPFSNRVEGNTSYTWTFADITTEKFSVEGKEYTYLAMGYVFAPIDEMSIPATLQLADGEEISFPEVKIEANYKSNIVGNLTK